MSSRPSLICPRCGAADGEVVSIDGTVVVRRCWCGHEFTVVPERPVPPVESVRVAS